MLEELVLDAIIEALTKIKQRNEWVNHSGWRSQPRDDILTRELVAGDILCQSEISPVKNNPETAGAVSVGAFQSYNCCGREPHMYVGRQAGVGDR
ncbi:MAG: hypothetical protein U5J98_00380 [Halobacteriales archaeon]|nr:hypothetical protein [Halobacteriales archaeon]